MGEYINDGYIRFGVAQISGLYHISKENPVWAENVKPIYSGDKLPTYNEIYKMIKNKIPEKSVPVIYVIIGADNYTVYLQGYILKED